MKISAKTVSLGNNKIKFVSLENIADVKMGLSSGDNKFYLEDSCVSRRTVLLHNG